MAGKKGRSGGNRTKLKEAKLLAGTFRPHREPDNVPAPVYADPDPPSSLDGEGADLWRYYVAELGNQGRRVLTNADRESMATLCQDWARYWQAQREVTKRGLLIDEPIVVRGEVVATRTIKNPAMVTAEKLSASLRGWVALFGLSPADRQRIPAIALPDSGKKKLRPRGWVDPDT